MKKQRGTKDGTEPKLCARELRHDDRKKETDLKRKRLFQTPIDYYRVIIKSKGPGCNFTWAVTRAYK
jgi:hypothetical protein